MVEVGPTLRLFALQDANWNVVVLVNLSGGVVERYVYTPFGQVTIMNGSYTAISSSAYGWVYSFQGGRQDAIIGDYHFQHRDYDPVLGAGRAWIRWGSRVGNPTFTRQRGMIRSGVLIRVGRPSLTLQRYRFRCITRRPLRSLGTIRIWANWRTKYSFSPWCEPRSLHGTCRMHSWIPNTNQPIPLSERI